MGEPTLQVPLGGTRGSHPSKQTPDKEINSLEGQKQKKTEEKWVENSSNKE